MEKTTVGIDYTFYANDSYCVFVDGTITFEVDEDTLVPVSVNIDDYVKTDGPDYPDHNVVKIGPRNIEKIKAFIMTELKVDIPDDLYSEAFDQEESESEAFWSANKYESLV